MESHPRPVFLRLQAISIIIKAFFMQMHADLHFLEVKRLLYFRLKISLIRKWKSLLVNELQRQVTNALL